MNTKSFKREQVVEIIGSVVQKMTASNQGIDEALVNDLLELKQALESFMAEVRQAQPAGIQPHVPMATSELDAIVAATESATHTIMESCENIQTAIKGDSNAGAVEKEITKIIEACTFQDITGQRITKIIKSLKQIDAIVKDLMVVLEKRFAGANDASASPAAASAEGKPLMSGPQLPGQGMSQEEIDKMLSEF